VVHTVGLKVRSQSLRTAIGEFRRLFADQSSSNIYLGVSGGVDSLALTCVAVTALRAEVASGAVKLHVIVVDHQLQSGSSTVAATAADAVRKLGVEDVQVVKVTVASPGGETGNLEARAREARFAAFEEVMVGSPILLLGHTRDDQAETVLLGLARGSGTSAVKGMKQVDQRDGYTICRPLLNLTRADTEEICRAAGVEFWTDPTNAGDPGDPMRSQLRRNVLPPLEHLFPGIRANLTRTAELAQADVDYLSAQALGALKKCEVDVAGDRSKNELDLAELRKVPDALRWRVIKMWIAQSEQLLTPNGAKSVPFERIKEIDDKLVKINGSGGLTVELEGGAKVVRNGSALRFTASNCAQHS
jgi:tRNA(Ile)-lysidine synthase